MAAVAPAPVQWRQRRSWSRFCPRRGGRGRGRWTWTPDASPGLRRPQSVGRCACSMQLRHVRPRARLHHGQWPDGLRQTTEDAVLNANYIRKNLEDVYELPYRTPTLHEVVFSDRRQTQKGVKTGDIAKRLIDYGFHPYTTRSRSSCRGADDRADGKRIERRTRSLYRRYAADRARAEETLSWFSARPMPRASRVWTRRWRRASRCCATLRPLPAALPQSRTV